MSKKEISEIGRRKVRRPRVYGRGLAEQVADALTVGRVLVPHHRDYCGLGLAYVEGKYVYAEVWDGHLQGLNTIDERPPYAIIFPDRTAFVNWLSQQSDVTLSRRELAEPFYWDNQTITRQRLRRFVEEGS